MLSLVDRHVQFSLVLLFVGVVSECMLNFTLSSLKALETWI